MVAEAQKKMRYVEAESIEDVKRMCEDGSINYNGSEWDVYDDAEIEYEEISESVDENDSHITASSIEEFDEGDENPVEHRKDYGEWQKN